jgi:hypothetical protein
VSTLGLILRLSTAAGGEDSALAAPRFVEVETGEVVQKFLLLVLAVASSGLLPLLLRGARRGMLGGFREGVIYALMPSIVAGAALASWLTGVSLYRMKFGTVPEFLPLPLTLAGMILAIQGFAGVVGALWQGAPGAGHERGT